LGYTIALGELGSIELLLHNKSNSSNLSTVSIAQCTHMGPGCTARVLTLIGNYIPECD